MTKGNRSPRECDCGCGGMTKGGLFLPGHDAKLKSRLKRFARRGDGGAFDQLVERGWACRGERLDYLGPTVSLPPPEDTLEVVGVDGTWAEVEDDEPERTVAGRLKGELRSALRSLRIPPGAFQRMWEKAMSHGWPDRDRVAEHLLNHAEIYRDEPGESVRVVRERHPTRTAKAQYRQSPCGACGICGSKWLVFDYRSGKHWETWKCKGCGLVSVLPARRIEEYVDEPEEAGVAELK